MKERTFEMLSVIACSRKEAPAVPAAARPRMFTLSYDREKPLLYSSAKITFDGKTFSTDRAIWDTGSTVTAFSQKIADGFHASPTCSGSSVSASDTVKSDIYVATIELPGGIIFHDVEVWGMPLSSFTADIIIGMDIISQGRLVVETQNGIPTFSFSVIQ